MQRKPIFDAVRGMLGRSFTQAEVSLLDAAIDRALREDDVDTSSPSGRQLGDAGIELIKQFEGCAKIRADGLVEAYPDPGTGGDPWTIGWGATGTGIRKGTVWTVEECDARFANDLKKYAADVEKVLDGAPTTQNQFDALVSFHYNTGAIGTATLTKLHKAGRYAEAEKEFARWKLAGGRVLPGLVRRREAEAALYRG